MSKIYYTTFDENGMRTATYLEEIHGAENIPPEAIQITEEEWALYCSGEYKRNMVTGEPEKIEPAPADLTPAQKRELEYRTRRYIEDGAVLIPWGDKALTVDEANKVYLEYLAEGSARAAEIQVLIIAAKGYVRELYPDA